MRVVVRIAVLSTEIFEAAMGRGKLPGPSPGMLLTAVVFKERKLVEEGLLVLALAAKNVGARQQRKEVATRGLADKKCHALGVRTLNQVEWSLMIANQRTNLLTGGKINAHLPQDAPRIDGAAC